MNINLLTSFPAYTSQVIEISQTTLDQMAEKPVHRLLIGTMALLLLVGCGDGRWKTSYTDVVTRSASDHWRPVDIRIIVPDSLTVSEANLFAPRADIVWQGEIKGDRRAQVGQIFKAAAQKATQALDGDWKVRIEIEIEQFHAVSDRARLIAPSAVHNLQFKIRIFDAMSERQIIPTDRIQADLPAYTGTQALRAVRAGQTQKVRITRHLENVLKGWLKLGGDPRTSFSAFGI